jgi:hypothetical protein
MTDGRKCACGFSETAGGDDTITDHLLEVFAPQNCRGNDGLVHEEAFSALSCLCGFTATTCQELDDHFLEQFTPADSVALGGVLHQVVA